MSKISVALLLVVATLSLANGDILNDMLSGNLDNGDILNDLLNLSQNKDVGAALAVLKILMNPSQPIDLKVAELFLTRTLQQLADNGESVDLKLIKANTLGVARAFSIDAEFTDSQDKVLKCKVDGLLQYLTNEADFTFDCAGQPPIVKHTQWQKLG